jgi:hypothetical protein
MVKRPRTAKYLASAGCVRNKKTNIAKTLSGSDDVAVMGAVSNPIFITARLETLPSLA